MTVSAYVFVCVECFRPVKLTAEEADERVTDDGEFRCDECQPLTDLIDRLADLHAERESRRLWAAMMVARDVETLESIRRGLPVHRRKLAPTVLARAGRGAPMTSADWVVITSEMLDAIDEAGPFR